MPRHPYYNQCLLHGTSKRMPGAVIVNQAWIPSHLAKKGLVVKLRNSAEEEWTIWEVVEVYQKRSGDLLEGLVEREYLHHRERTDK